MNRLASLFPGTVKTVYSDRPPQKLELLSAENKTTKNMRENRIREFAHGRACARQALAALGISPCPIPVGENREPVWPEQIAGSISHCGRHAAAVAAHHSDIPGLGVDLELNESLEDPLLKMVCRPEELHRLDRSGTDYFLDKLIFSAKESLYKCVWPTLRQFIDFQEIEIRLDLAGYRYAAVSHNPQLPDALINRIHGRFMHMGDLIITSAYVG